MDDLELQIAMDGIGQALRERGKTVDEIFQILMFEVERVCEEIEDGENG